jgi:hypothetical protein
MEYFKLLENKTDMEPEPDDPNDSDYAPPLLHRQNPKNKFKD